MTRYRVPLAEIGYGKYLARDTPRLNSMWWETQGHPAPNEASPDKQYDLLLAMGERNVFDSFS